MRIWTRAISYVLLTLFCWQLTVMFVSPFFADRITYTVSETSKEIKSNSSHLECSGDVIDWDAGSSLIEEVLEEEIEITGSVHISLLSADYISYAEALILPCRNFNQTQLDPPELTV